MSEQQFKPYKSMRHGNWQIRYPVGVTAPFSEMQLGIISEQNEIVEIIESGYDVFWYMCNHNPQLATVMIGFTLIDILESYKENNSPYLYEYNYKNQLDLLTLIMKGDVPKGLLQQYEKYIK